MENEWIAAFRPKYSGIIKLLQVDGELIRKIRKEINRVVSIKAQICPEASDAC
jgi:hypothetical protein